VRDPYQLALVGVLLFVGRSGQKRKDVHVQVMTKTPSTLTTADRLLGAPHPERSCTFTGTGAGTRTCSRRPHAVVAAWHGLSTKSREDAPGKHTQACPRPCPYATVLRSGRDEHADANSTADVHVASSVDVVVSVNVNVNVR